jgi:hypothetical protein
LPPESSFTFPLGVTLLPGFAVPFAELVVDFVAELFGALAFFAAPVVERGDVPIDELGRRRAGGGTRVLYRVSWGCARP